MGRFSKTDVIRIIHKCAVLYHENLSGKNIMFVTVNENGADYFEALFQPQNFLHLTGVKTNLNSIPFYTLAIKQRLSPSHIIEPDDIVKIKLEALPVLMSIHTTARMVGDYDNSRPLLVTDKFAGTVTAAMGFIKTNNMYIPNTALKKDLRDITSQSTRHRVTAIFTKRRVNALYDRLTYIAKGVSIDGSIIASTIHEKVDFKNLTAAFPIPYEGTNS